MVGGAIHIFCTEFPKTTQSEEETKTTDASMLNLTLSSDVKQHQNCVTLWNKMLTNEEVIMTVKLWGVDRLHLCLDYYSEPNSYSFLAFLFKMLFIYLFMKLTHIQVFKKECMKLEYNISFYKQIPCSFFWWFVFSDIHITKYIQIIT